MQNRCGNSSVIVRCQVSLASSVGKRQKNLTVDLDFPFLFNQVFGQTVFLVWPLTPDNSPLFANRQQ